MKPQKKLFNWRLYLLTSDLAPTTRHVLLTLSTHMDEWGNSAFPTIGQLAYETGLSRKSIITHLQKADEAGWIEKHLHGYGGQKWRSNEYEPTIPDDAEITQWKDTETYRRSREGGERRTPPQPKGGASVTPPSDKKVVNLVPKGGEPRSKGGEPNDQKVVKEVHPSTSLSTSISTSGSTSGYRQEKMPAKSTPAWEAYFAAYVQRHQVEPVRNKKVNSQLCHLVDRVGENAPAIAEFFVWHNNSYYVARMHSVDLLLNDAESLHAQWQQGQQMTQTRARQTDKTQNNLSVVQNVIEKRQILEHDE